MKVVGLTGGIGSGKSVVAKILAELGAGMIDADKVGHSVYEPGTVGWQRVVDTFGKDIVAPDETIDRKRLGAMVFADPKRLAELNRLVHPLIAEAVSKQIESRRQAGYEQPIVVEAAVLIEANWQHLVDEIWLVVADRERVIERLRAQRNLDRQAIEARMKAQLSDEERRRYATVVIDNSGPLEDLRRRLEILWRERVLNDQTGRARV